MMCHGSWNSSGKRKPIVSHKGGSILAWRLPSPWTYWRHRALGSNLICCFIQCFPNVFGHRILLLRNSCFWGTSLDKSEAESLSCLPCVSANWKCIWCAVGRQAGAFTVPPVNHRGSGLPGQVHRACGAGLRPHRPGPESPHLLF